MESAQPQQQQPQQNQQNIVNTVVNANNAFISSLDHLPCEIIRSLWLIQSLNLKNERIKKDLDLLLKQKGKGNGQQLESRFQNLKMLMLRYSREIVAESAGLSQTIKDHLKFLDNDLRILQDYDDFRKMNKDPKQRWQMFDSFKRKFADEHSQEIQDTEHNVQTLLPKKRASEPVSAFSNKRGKSTMVIKIDLKRFKNEPVDEKSLQKVTIKESKPDRKSHNKEKKHKDENVQTPTYCFCHGPSFGRMIACDNPKCEYEWFHYKCVGLHEDPDVKKKWFCSKKCHHQYWADIARKKRRKKRLGNY